MTSRAGTAPRSALGCHFELRHFGVWRSMVAVTASSALSALLGWLISSAPARSVEVVLCVAVAGLAIVVIALSLANTASGTLDLAGGRASYTPNDRPLDEPESGQLSVAIDLGGFMLLVLHRDAGAGRRWLPVQRLGHQAGWHALRCAAHAPRSAHPPPRPATE